MSETNDAMNIEDSGLSNDTSFSSFTAYSNTQTNNTSVNNANSTTNYGADAIVSWESAVLRLPSLFTNDFSPAALLFPQVLYICFVLHALEYTLFRERM